MASRNAKNLFEVQGLDALGRKLARGDKIYSKARLQSASDIGAKEIADTAATLAPRLTGTLSREIGTEPQDTNSALVADTLVGFGKRAFYGKFVEFDQPFLRPAFDETKDEAVQQMRQELRLSMLKWVRSG